MHKSRKQGRCNVRSRPTHNPSSLEFALISARVRRLCFCRTVSETDSVFDRLNKLGVRSCMYENHKQGNRWQERMRYYMLEHRLPSADMEEHDARACVRLTRK